MTMDVILYEVFAEEAEAIQRHLPKGITAQCTPHTIQAAGHATPPAALITIRTQSRIPPSWPPHLAGILTRSTGFDHLVALRRRVACGYLPAYCAQAVAEHAILMMLALARKLTRQQQQFASFNRDGLTGVECRGRRALIVGVGHIGTALVQVAAGLGMDVKGVDVVHRMPTLDYVPLADGIQWADVIVCALPLTRLTRGLLNYECLQRARPGLLLINIARAEISPLQDLSRLLDERILGGVGLDVYEEEPLLAESLRSHQHALPASGRELLALRERDDVVCTPHNAFNTREALERKAQQSCEAIARFLREGAFPYPVPDEGAR